MDVSERLHEAFRERAAQARVSDLSIGLGYTAVTTDDGRMGLAYTMMDRTGSCTHVRTFQDFSGRPATDLLDYVTSDDTLERSMAIALVNALNEPIAAAMSRDSGPNTGFVAQFGVAEGTRVAMVGFFGPVIAGLKKRGAELSILDRGHQLGDEATFLARLESWPDVLVITATSLINGTFDGVLERVGDGVRVVVMGPSTPMVSEVYAGLPVHMLAGMVPVAKDKALAVIRQGGGTPELSPHSHKVFWLRDDVTALRPAS
jgi:uncharacterized protein (DUF4213/DUF364 family)